MWFYWLGCPKITLTTECAGSAQHNTSRGSPGNRTVNLRIKSLPPRDSLTCSFAEIEFSTSSPCVAGTHFCSVNELGVDCRAQRPYTSNSVSISFSKSWKT